MNIDFVEIRNFRRLSVVRIDFSKETTLFVGANNSGKTSAITALRYFLKEQNAFSVYDIPLALWTNIDKFGEAFVDGENEESLFKWEDLLPSLDTWLQVSENEIHHVAHLIPTLDWKPEEGIGVRLQLEPKNPEELMEAFKKAKMAAYDTLNSKQESKAPSKETKKQKTNGLTKINGSVNDFTLWPKKLMDFFKRHMSRYLTVNAYLLDPDKKQLPSNGMAQLQKLPDKVEPLDNHPFKGLIEINEVPAHRGLDDHFEARSDVDTNGPPKKGRNQPLTAQLRAYYGKHLDPEKAPEANDLQALQAIHEAQNTFDARLKDSFQNSLNELQDLGYPGFSDPRLTISTALKPVEGLGHQSAVQYDVASPETNGTAPYRLPEQYNGLGYQNLISMFFRLISYRDGWMKVGKAARIEEETETRQVSPPPMHLVLLEEPEAHLHVQVQQVFIRKAHEILCNHPDLQGGDSQLSTQLVVSTHSSHIAHEVDYAKMRYFRRHPARNPGETPSSTVVNLSEIFGEPDDTARFVSRYLKATHADLFFADGAILVEGAAERMLIPHFIKRHYEKLHACYVTLLEVGGSHAHRLRSLIEYLGLNTLIITDLDAINGENKRKKITPRREKGLLTCNNVLKTWHPQEESIDKLLDLKEDKKEKCCDDFCSVRVAYQVPVQVKLKGEKQSSEGIPRTFEDALAFENVDFFRQTNGTGILKKFKNAIETNIDATELGEALLKALESGSKAEFALDILYSETFESIQVPEYIHKGLLWLENILMQRQQEVQLPQIKNTEDSDRVEDV